MRPSGSPDSEEAAVNHLFFPERYVEDTIERIAADRAASERIGGEFRPPAFVGTARQRIGTVLIKIGERVGGPAVRAPRTSTPRPHQTPLLGF